MYHINNLLNTRQAEIVALCDIYKPHLDQAAALCPRAKNTAITGRYLLRLMYKAS